MIEHKKLIDYLPPFLAEYREYQRYFEVLQDEEDSILHTTDRALENTFVSQTDLEGIERWEKMLHITPNAEETLDERRDAITFKLAGMRPFTMRRLKEILDITIGPGECTLELDEYTLTVLIALTSSFKQATISAMLRRILPANIAFTLELKYHRHSEYNNTLTHGQMAAYTHTTLREGVLDE